MVAACPFPANHGSPASISEMSQALSSLGHKIHIVTYPMGQDIPTGDVLVHRVGRIFGKKRIIVGPTYYKPLLDLLLLIKTCRLILEEKIDIIHAHNYEGAIIGYIAKKITKRPMLYNAVNNMISELPFYDFIRPRKLAIILADFLDNMVPKMGDYITVVSEELRSFMLQKGIPQDRISIIPAGVNPGMFEGIDGEIMRKRYGIGSRPLVVYTGTLDRFQRIDLLMSAMRVVIDKISDARLLIAGNIINRTDIEVHLKLAEDLRLKDKIIFTDERPFEEVPYFLASADVAVVPRPYCPGFPVKLLNYMAAGKAIVTFEGSAKSLKHMKEVAVVRNEDWEDMGLTIVLLLKDRALAKKLGDTARASITGRFDWPTLAGKIGNIYHRLLFNRGGYG